MVHTIQQIGQESLEVVAILRSLIGVKKVLIRRIKALKRAVQGLSIRAGGIFFHGASPECDIGSSCSQGGKGRGGTFAAECWRKSNLGADTQGCYSRQPLGVCGQTGAHKRGNHCFTGGSKQGS